VRSASKACNWRVCRARAANRFWTIPSVDTAEPVDSCPRVMRAEPATIRTCMAACRAQLRVSTMLVPHCPIGHALYLCMQIGGHREKHVDEFKKETTGYRDFHNWMPSAPEKMEANALHRYTSQPSGS